MSPLLQASDPRQLSHATPPDSFTSAPPTPPPTDQKTKITIFRIVQHLQTYRAGRDLNRIPWSGYSLSPEGYQELLRHLKSNQSLWTWVQDKLRYDYFPSAKRLILRMPSAVHEGLIALVVKEIQQQLESVRGIATGFAQEVYSYNSASIKFPEPDYGKHDLDAQFLHSEAIADDHILGLDSGIRAVMGLDIEYKKSKEASISIWRPKIEPNEAGENELTSHQTVTRQADFAPEEVDRWDNCAQDHIEIPAATLCAFLDSAKEKAAMVDKQRGVVATKTWVRKRRRDTTPLEELADKDKKRFRTQESSILEQASADDGSFRTSSSISEVGSI
ncbi:hypothetical protein BP5796_13227 [Coleophoma crateriformis]|uniref:Uncharacterized protein n=1 Tax=Coleophoma crateriformis TaxID=565419 RepID=A0A3D8Q359_9HELO|nr:hypothetical protein BP5796_13227 [Coleophoma crateriformis]